MRTYWEKESVPYRCVEDSLEMYQMRPDGETLVTSGDLCARVRHQGRIITEKEAKSLAAMMPPIRK